MLRKARKQARRRVTPPMEYYARGLHVAKMGPFATYEEASMALLGHDGLPVARAFIWAVRKGAEA